MTNSAGARVVIPRRRLLGRGAQVIAWSSKAQSLASDPPASGSNSAGLRPEYASEHPRRPGAPQQCRPRAPSTQLAALASALAQRAELYTLLGEAL